MSSVACRGRCQSSADRRGSGLGAALACAEQPAARRGPPKEVLGLWVERVGKRGCPVHELRLPLPRVKSPPWHMNCVMTRWKEEPLKWSGLPERPVPVRGLYRQTLRL